MRFTDLFIRRPVIAIVVNLVIVIAGLQAIRSLNVRQYPKSENAAITVNTVYVGASADLVRGFITTPLERVIAAADGIDYIESESKQNLSTIRARLRLNHDAQKALAEIGSKVDQVRGDLPPEAQVPVLNIESADSQFASAYLAFTSKFLKHNEITDYLVRVVQPRLSAIEGVQRAEILGGRTFAMRIWLKPDRMAARGLAPPCMRLVLGGQPSPALRFAVVTHGWLRVDAQEGSRPGLAVAAGDAGRGERERCRAVGRGRRAEMGGVGLFNPARAGAAGVTGGAGTVCQSPPCRALCRIGRRLPASAGIGRGDRHHGRARTDRRDLFRPSQGDRKA